MGCFSSKGIKLSKRSFQKAIEIFPRKSIEVDYKDTKPFILPFDNLRLCFV